MSGSGVEQDSSARNHKPPPFGRQSSAPAYSQSPHDNSSPFDISPIAHFSPLASLGGTTYSSLRSGLDPTISVSTNHLPSSGHFKAGGHESPDPDDFYRQRDELEPNPTGDFGNVTTGASNSMATGYRNPNDRLSSLPANVVDPSRSRRPTYRSTSDSPTLGGHSGSASRNVPNVRHRNTSIRDLVSKFEEKSDQVLPLPSASRPSSRAASPAGSADGADRSRLAPRRQLRDCLPPISVTSNPRLQSDSTPASPEVERLGETNAVIPPPLVERIPISHPRRPLFGELLSVDTQLNNLGYGIPAHLRRRGSDGSIPSPNPAFAEYSNPPSARSPLTPTAWYLGQAGSLEAVSIAANTAHQRMNGHRRVRSDLSVNTQKEPLAEPWAYDMAVSVPLQPGDGSPGSPNSKSRIPVSSHRLVTASGPESLSSNANNPTFSSRSNATPLAPKGSSRLPKPSLKDSPPRMTEDGPTSFAMTARGRRDTTIGRTRTQVPERNRHLQAYISVPPPKKSPPLRSSRPRQPVSQGVPTSPHSRVGDRVSSLQRSADRDTEARNTRPRQRRIPELGNVDFETRRQRIQQAFNRTVQENERKEEEAAELRRRRSQYLEAGVDKVESPSDEKTLTPATAANLIPPHVEMATLVKESTGTPGDNKEPRSVPQLNLVTIIDPPNDDAPHTTMDSPTLGVPDGVPRESRGAVPDSAIKTGSSETRFTHFSPESQSELIERKHSADHRTLLDHIMQIRESSDSDSCDEPDCSMSENDGKQSIQIMLRDTPYFHSTSMTDAEEPRQLARHSQAAQHQTRWSLSSWTSSVHNQNDTCDEECDESGDDLVLQMPPPGQQAPPTQSCSAASTSPPSDNDPPIQDLGVMGPATLNNTPQLQPSSVFSTPPSLARQGRWDSRRATQLYLEELTRGKNNNSTPLPPMRTSQDYSSLEVDTRAQYQADSLTDDGVVVPRFEEKPMHERLSHGASLVGREDWENASPSIMDWMHIAAEDEAVTPAHEKPGFINDGVPTPTPRLMMSVAELEGSNDPNAGLGLSVNHQAAYELQRRPVELPTETESTSEESRTIQGPHSVSGRVPTLRDPTLSTGSSAGSSFQRVESTQSPLAADSSATSLVPSLEHPALVEPKKSPSPEQRRLKKRRHIIKELVDTEYTFGRDMKVVDDIYKGTSSSCLDLSADDVKVLFGNSELVVQFSMSLQDALKKAARSVYIMPRSQRWASRRNTRNAQPGAMGDDEQLNADAGISGFEKDRATTLGAAFLTHMSEMEKVYTEYLKNHDAANKKLQLLQRNPKVAIWLKECRDWAADLTSAWDLDSLLVKPVQRILKYPLLLAQLLEATPDDHPDRANLSSALQDVTNISVRINEMKKRADLVTQVVGRKRNQSDVRAGLSKAFGRRTEKLRQQVGLSDMYEDRDYDALSEKFAEQYIQLQLMVRDVQDYVESTKRWMIQYNELASTIEGLLDVHHSPYPELDSKWRGFRMSVRDIINDALPEHVSSLPSNCARRLQS